MPCMVEGSYRGLEEDARLIWLNGSSRLCSSFKRCAKFYYFCILCVRTCGRMGYNYILEPYRYLYHLLPPPLSTTVFSCPFTFPHTHTQHNIRQYLNNDKKKKRRRRRRRRGKKRGKREIGKEKSRKAFPNLRFLTAQYLPGS